MKNIKITISYDGTAYHGWQVQENAITIQQTLETSLGKLFKTSPPSVTGCGRTDTGVHAKKYVCNFFADTSIPMEKLPRGHMVMNPMANSIRPAQVISRSGLVKWVWLQLLIRHWYMHMEKSCRPSTVPWELPQPSLLR